MLGKSLTYLTDKRRRLLIRSDTAPSVPDVSGGAIGIIITNSDQSSCGGGSSSNSTNCNSQSNSPITAEKYRSHRTSSPPSTIKYRIRNKSPNNCYPVDSRARRKLSDTTINVLRNNKKKRSQSIDYNRKLSITNTTPMNEVNFMKLSRSLSKRLPRSGSAKNLMELRDDSSLVWNDGKFMQQREIYALFKAIESNDLKKVEAILSTHTHIVNSSNSLDLTPLDMAMLLGYPTVAKRLMEFGGHNNEYFENDPPKLMHRHLTLHTNNCATQLTEMCGHLYGSSGSLNRDVEAFEAMHQQLKLLKSNLEHMKPGSQPRKVTLEVAGLYSLLVTVSPPSDNIVTRYCIEWSRREDFSEIDDEIVVRAKFPVGRYQILDLQPHVTYFVRVRSFNLKGAGAALLSSPRSETPTCWTELSNISTETLANNSSNNNIPSISRRRPVYPSDWTITRIDDEETRVTQQIQFWLAAVRSTIKTGPSNHSYGSSTSNLDNVSTNPNDPSPVTESSSSGRLKIPGLSLAVGSSSSNSSSANKKSSILKPFMSSSSKFVRNAKHGLYIALVCYAQDTDKLLLNGDEQLPLVQVEEEIPSVQNATADSLWLARMLSNSGGGATQFRLLAELVSRLNLPASVHTRVRLLGACLQLQTTLGWRDHLGLVSAWQPPTITTSTSGSTTSTNGSVGSFESSISSVVIIITRVLRSQTEVPNPPTSLRWTAQTKLILSELNPVDLSSRFLNQYQRARPPLPSQTTSSTLPASNCIPSDGLYLGFMQCRSTLEQLFVLLHSVGSPVYLPMIKMRENWHVDAIEWQCLRNIQQNLEVSDEIVKDDEYNKKGRRFRTQILDAWERLCLMLQLNRKESNNETNNNTATPAMARSVRIYIEEVVRLRPRLTLLLVVPHTDYFCLIPGIDGPRFGVSSHLEWVSLHAFELFSNLHSFNGVTGTGPGSGSDTGTGSLAALQATLDMLIPLAQQASRQAFEQSEMELCRERLSELQTIQGRLDKLWRETRWAVDVINNCRDKLLSTMVTVPMEALEASDALNQQKSLLFTEIHCPESSSSSPESSQRCMDCRQIKERAKNSLDDSALHHSQRRQMILQHQKMHKEEQTNHSRIHSKSVENLERSAMSSISGNDTINLEEQNSGGSNSTSELLHQKQKQKTGVLRIYTGYPCGLLEGTSVKVLLTPQTTSADVVRLIVRQLNVTAREHNPTAPVYSEFEIDHKFCLSVSINNMSRPLPDNFHPLLLKQPWKSGKLTVVFRSV